MTRAMAWLAYPQCGKVCTSHDKPLREWRQLDTCQYRIVPVADGDDGPAHTRPCQRLTPALASDGP